MIARGDGSWAQAWVGVLPILDVGARLSRARAEHVACEMLDGGARAIELRGKDLPASDLLDLGRRLRQLTRARGAILIVNDRPDVALLVEADGVHLGQHDLPAREARRWLPASIHIGVSCHTLGEVEQAHAERIASYVGYGPVYETRSKRAPDPLVGLEGLRVVCERFPSLDVVAIGGISLERLPEVRRTGARAAAMISALVGSNDVEERTREALRMWNRP